MKVRFLTMLRALPGVIAVALAVAALASRGAEPPPPTVSAGASAHLERLVRARTVAWFTADLDGYSKYTATRFLWNGASVPQSRRTQFPDTRPFEITGLQVFEYPNVAVVSYVLTEYLNYEEGAPFDRQRRTETWVRDKTGWKAAAAQSSEACTSSTGRDLRY
jgi:hypothetical protein